MTLKEGSQRTTPLTSLMATLKPIRIPNRQKVPKNIPLKLRFWMLPDRRIRLLGKTLQSIRLPKDTAAKVATIRMVVNLYFPCLRANGSTHTLDENCSVKREKQLLAWQRMNKQLQKTKLNGRPNIKLEYLFARKNSIR